MNFNLVDQPWLPCIGQDGRRREVGIREALAKAHEFAGLRDPSPLVTAALHRLLLAVLHAALRGPKDLAAWKALWTGGSFDLPEFAAYLDRWRNRFDLFDAAHPFYQVPGLVVRSGKSAKESATNVSRLVHEISAGNNATLFDHSYDSEVPALSPDACARALVAAQAYSLAAR